MKDRYIVENHLYQNVYEITHTDEAGHPLGIYKGYYDYKSNTFKVYPIRLVDRKSSIAGQVISGYNTEKRSYS